jgi:hypothetical protein
MADGFEKPEHGRNQKRREIDGTQTAQGHTSQRDFLIQSSRTAAGAEIAALLGNFGHWTLSYGADKEPIKIGVLHSSASRWRSATCFPRMSCR